MLFRSWVVRSICGETSRTRPTRSGAPSRLIRTGAPGASFSTWTPGISASSSISLLTEILEGLDEGEIVVADAGSSLHDGDQIKTMFAEDLDRTRVR